MTPRDAATALSVAEADDCADDTAAPTVDRPQLGQSPKPLPIRAELDVRFRSPPAASHERTRFLVASGTFDLFGIVKRIVDAKAQFRSLAEPWADSEPAPGA